MSKTTKKVEKKGLSANTKKGIIISAICIVMAIVLAVSVTLVVSNSGTTTNSSTSSSGSSSLYIKNGDFAYFDTESTSYPKTADNWTLYTYTDPVTDSDGIVTEHGFDKITDTDAVLTGVVSTDEEEWDNVTNDLADENISGITNPGIHDEDLDKNVFMFASKNATTASIVSESFSIASQESAKITVWLNTAQLKSGGATIMVQNYNSSTSLSALEKYRYSYAFDIAAADGWVAYELYVFNRNSGSENVVVSIGLGNTYEGTEAEGVLFVDDITYETVSANEYRKFVASAQNDTTYHIIGEDESVSEENYATFVDINGEAVDAITLQDYLDSNDAKVGGESYSPFTINDKFSIYKISNDGTISTPVALILNQWKGQDIIVKSSEEATDHLHISFWLRVMQDGRVTAKGNIVLQTLENGEWTDLDSGSFTSIVTSQNIKDDNNCGWVKYDIYLKPTYVKDTQIRVVCALGNANGYSNANPDYLPKGSLFVTSPFVEEISSSDYSSASSGSYSTKVSLVGDTASTSITNGSFSSIAASTPDQPVNWTPAFGGANIIYKDGLGDKIPQTLPQNSNDVTALIVKNSEYAPAFDDSERNFLQITNNVATSYGLLSNDFTLSAKTVYAISVLAKTTDSAKPYIYVVRNGADSRSEAILGKIEANATTLADDSVFGMINSTEEGNGWTRYYIVIATGEESVTVRLALFNGSIDGTVTQQGTVCYDIASLTTLGTYTIDTDEESDKTNRERITFTATSGYTAFEELSEEEIANLANYDNVYISEPDWEEIVANAMAEESEEEDDDDNSSTSTTERNIDWALLASVVSSIAMVGALLIVAVVRIFKKRSRNA